MNILSVKNLSKIYGDENNHVIALDNVSFDVEIGEFIAIIGASGSGKSTLLHQIGGVDHPSSGKVIINNTDIYTLNENDLAIFRRNEIGLIYQFYNLIPVLNVKENITLPLQLAHQKVDQKRFNTLIEQLGLSNRLKHLPNQLSGGQQQRVSIARALINQPSLVLADEPTGNLDSKNSDEIIRLLKEANEKYHQTIPEMFEVSETYFRNNETAGCKDVSDLNGHIISTGGGVVLRPENIKYLKQNGIIIYIDRPIDNILTDVQVTSRPLLKEGPQKLYELDKQRHQLYLEACDHRIVNDDTLENITDKIIELITKNKFED